MGGKWSTEIQVKRKMLQVQVGFELFQPNWSFNVDKKKPQEYCWYAKTFFCVPNILDPDVGAGGEEQPMNRDEQKANHVGRDGNANEEYWECQSLVFEWIVDTSKKQPEGP